MYSKVCLNGESLEVKEYRPHVFAMLRTHAGIDEVDYSSSLTSDNLCAITSDSKSGQSFWTSSNGRVVLKTIKDYEARNMIGILDSYALHVTMAPSAIAAVLGLYRVTNRAGKKTYFLACANVYPSVAISRKFDLKGSLVGRKASPSSSVAKDLDLISSGASLKFSSSR